MQKNGRDKIDSLTNKTIKELSDISNVKQIIGTPIPCGENSMLIPVSKMTLAYISGGGEYGEVKLFDKNKNKPFLGGGGAVVNYLPTGFLYLNNGVATFVKVPDDPLEKAFDGALNFVANTLNEKSTK